MSQTYKCSLHWLNWTKSSKKIYCTDSSLDKPPSLLADHAGLSFSLESEVKFNLSLILGGRTSWSFSLKGEQLHSQIKWISDSLQDLVAVGVLKLQGSNLGLPQVEWSLVRMLCDRWTWGRLVWVQKGYYPGMTSPEMTFWLNTLNPSISLLVVPCSFIMGLKWDIPKNKKLWELQFPIKHVSNWELMRTIVLRTYQI